MAEATGEDAPQEETTTSRPEIKSEMVQDVPGTANPQVMQVLRVYPAYPDLYVDHHGGAYTPDTPASMRRDAVLYKNPFYEPSKNIR